jgi:hypothetical protein
MKRHILLLCLAVALLLPASALAEDAGGCAPQYRALAQAAAVELKGTGDIDLVVLTDPLCWHCRLAHKLLGEYPEMYATVKLLFFPRPNFIGSDMAAWVLEDAAGTDRLKPLVDFAYDDLRKPSVENLEEARMLVLVQFTQAFPSLIEGTTLSDLFDRLKRDHEAHVLAGADLARAAAIPGTPVLIAGSNVVVGYGPDAWLEAIGKKQLCP